MAETTEITEKINENKTAEYQNQAIVAMICIIGATIMALLALVCNLKQLPG